SGDPCLLEQRLGLVDVAFADRKGLLVIGIFRVHPLIAWNEFAVEHDLIERLAVDGVIERLAHLGRTAERIFRPLAVPDIDVNAHIAEPERGREPEPRSERTSLISVASTRSIRSRPPLLRLAIRTVSSTIGKYTTRSICTLSLFKQSANFSPSLPPCGTRSRTVYGRADVGHNRTLPPAPRRA